MNFKVPALIGIREGLEGVAQKSSLPAYDYVGRSVRAVFDPTSWPPIAALTKAVLPNNKNKNKNKMCRRERLLRAIWSSLRRVASSTYRNPNWMWSMVAWNITLEKLLPMRTAW